MPRSPNSKRSGVDVEPNSMGDKAGIKANDVLVKVNNQAVPNVLLTAWRSL